jgi:hypothetical protein
MPFEVPEYEEDEEVVLHETGEDIAKALAEDPDFKLTEEDFDESGSESEAGTDDDDEDEFDELT